MDEEPVSRESQFMGSKISPAIIFTYCLVLSIPVAFAFDSWTAEYDQTDIKLENGNDQKVISKITVESQVYDHSARLYQHSEPQKLIIVHYKSSGIHQVKSRITDNGISVEAAPRDNDGSGIDTLQQGIRRYPLTKR